MNKNDHDLKNYKMQRRMLKRIVNDANLKPYDGLYHKFKTTEWGKKNCVCACLGGGAQSKDKNPRVGPFYHTTRLIIYDVFRVMIKEF